MESKLKSRKLWVTIAAGVLVTLGERFGIDLDTEQVISLGLMVIAYIGGQAVVDKQKIASEVQERVPSLITALNDALQRVQALEFNSEVESQDDPDPLDQPYL